MKASAPAQPMMTMKNEYGLEVVNIRLVKEQTLYSDKPAESPKQAVEIVDGKALLEASGNLTKERIKSVAELGVDILSIGALTHSVTAFDISMKIKK